MFAYFKSNRIISGNLSEIKTLLKTNILKNKQHHRKKRELKIRSLVNSESFNGDAFLLKSGRLYIKKFSIKGGPTALDTEWPSLVHRAIFHHLLKSSTRLQVVSYVLGCHFVFLWY